MAKYQSIYFLQKGVFKMGKTVSRSKTTARKSKISIGKIAVLVILGLLALILLVYLGRNFLIKTVVAIEVQKAMGMKVAINQLDLELFPGELEIKGLTVYNPPGFEGEALVKIPSIDAEFDLPTLLAGKFHFRYLNLNINEFNIVKNYNKELNLNRIQAIVKANSGPATTPANNKSTSFRIDQLVLTLSHVNNLNYSKRHPSVQRIPLGIYRERFYNLRSIDDIVKLVVVRVVLKAGLYNLGLPLRALDAGFSHAGNSIGNGINNTTRGVNRFFKKIFKK